MNYNSNLMEIISKEDFLKLNKEKLADKAVELQSALNEALTDPETALGKATSESEVKIAELETAANESANKIAELEAKVAEQEIALSETAEKIAELESKITEQEETISNQEALIDELTEENKKTPVPTIAGESHVDVGGVKHKILCKKFKHKNVEYTAVDLQANPKLAAELVKMGSGILKPVK